jgi:hypothetical protein
MSALSGGMVVRSDDLAMIIKSEEKKKSSLSLSRTSPTVNVNSRYLLICSIEW